MTDHCECPICMDVIDATKNRVVTECGHTFHCSCLMQNAAHNGFGCPFCRTAMAEEPEDDEVSEEDNWSDRTDEDNNEVYDDYALRGLRFMTNNLEGAAHDILDVHDENEYQEEEAEHREDTNVPNASFIAEKLTEQGVTMEQLVKSLMVNHEEYQDLDMFDDLDEAESNIFGKMRIIISNYSPDQSIPVPQAAVEPISTPLPTPTSSINAPGAPVRNTNTSEPKQQIIPRRLEMDFMECAAE